MNEASDSALDRLIQRPECYGLFKRYGSLQGGQRGLENLTKTYVYGLLGTTECPNDQAIAATYQGESKTYLCPAFFERYSPEEREFVLIHEAVHTAGLGPNHEGMTSQQFHDNVVKANCS